MSHKAERIHVSKENANKGMIKAAKRASRNEALTNGAMKHTLTGGVVKSQKAYTRKEKHKKRF